jgi:hypothetical protein
LKKETRFLKPFSQIKLKKKGDDTTNKLRDGKGDIKKDISEIQFI